MLKKKVLLFNKLLKFSFFYRVNKKDVLGVDLIGTHSNCLLFNLDKFLFFMFRLTPFFFNLIKKQGGIFFIGTKFILLKWFKEQKQKGQQEFIVAWKGGMLSNFFCSRIISKTKGKQYLSLLPIAFIFINFDKYLAAFKEINKFNLPIIGLFEKSLNPSLIYSLGGIYQSFFINCFFFKLFSRFLKHLV